jgi:KDO2-lipid IV(A) lauroyltransferase
MPRRSVLKRVRDFLFYLLVLILIRFFNLLPRITAIRLGGRLGSLGYFLFPSDRKTSIENLKLAFGSEFESAKLLRISKGSFRNVGECAVDVFRHRKLGGEGVRKLVTIEGWGYFDHAYRQGRGVLAVTGHVSNFELIAAFFCALGYKVSVIGRKIYYQPLNRLLIESRQVMGMKNIDSEASPREFIRHLREGRGIGVLIDQDSRRYRGVFVDFFGKAAYTPVGPFVVARKTDTPVVPMAIFRNPDYTYTLKVGPAITLPDTGDGERDTMLVVQSCTHFLEKTIRAHPEQWVWMHKRWRTQPVERGGRS